MTGGQAHPARVTGDTPGAAELLRRALDTSPAVLVHRSGTAFADGAVDRLVRALRRPHRRLVRVHSDAGPCYLASSELLALALRHGVSAEELVADEPGLDRRIAAAADIVPAQGPTPVQDPAAGQWRVWLDGPVVGVRSSASADPRWEQRVVTQHSTPAGLLRLARRRAGRVRREIVRRRQRPAGR